jgi:hypothetical protein
VRGRAGAGGDDPVDDPEERVVAPGECDACCLERREASVDIVVLNADAAHDAQRHDDPPPGGEEYRRDRAADGQGQPRHPGHILPEVDLDLREADPDRLHRCRVLRRAHDRVKDVSEAEFDRVHRFTGLALLLRRIRCSE